MTTDQKLIRNKLGLRDLAGCLKNVSEACPVMGSSRDMFYRVKNAYGDGGIEALTEKSKRMPNLKNRIPEDIEAAVLELTLENPALGQKRVSYELRRRGVFVSAAGVRYSMAQAWPGSLSEASEGLGSARGEDRPCSHRGSA